MAEHALSAAATHLEALDIYATSYKAVNGHGIKANVLILKNLMPEKSPLFVKWHCGALVLGEALYKKWFSAWLIPFMLRNNTSSILFNYHLIPKHTGIDIIKDLSDF